VKDHLILQFSPQSNWLEEGLNGRFEVERWFENKERESWLKANATRVRAVVTSGDFGLPDPLMDSLTDLGLVAINGVGFDKVNLDRARARGIRVSTTPDVLTNDVADAGVGLAIGLLRGIPRSDRFVRDGEWLHGNMPLGRTVSGKRFGIVGLGRIGHAIAARVAVYGPVSYTGPSEKPVPYRYVPSLRDLARESDILFLASPANESTFKSIDASILGALGPEGYLVNISRGSLVDEVALVEALQKGLIAGAALDVFADEPRVPLALCEMNNVVLTPHIGSATVETRKRMAELVLENLDAFFNGSPLPSALI
jgi:lactate dehydrogenase-like 2-hydroxyacid dehydrogenase